MIYDVLLTKDPQNGYTARPLLAPEIIVTGDTEAETLSHVQAALTKLYNQSRIVQVEVPVADDDLWLDRANIKQNKLENENAAGQEKASKELTDRNFLLSIAGTFSSSSQETAQEAKSVVRDAILKKYGK